MIKLRYHLLTSEPISKIGFWFKMSGDIKPEASVCRGFESGTNKDIGSCLWIQHQIRKIQTQVKMGKYIEVPAECAMGAAAHWFT